VFGIPLAAALHTALQTAADPLSRDDGAMLTLLHFVLGVLVGSLILGPTFSEQALVSIALGKAGAGRWIQVPVGAVVQASFVAVWALIVGMEPSLPGRFSLALPMIGRARRASAAGAMSGCLPFAPALR